MTDAPAPSRPCNILADPGATRFDARRVARAYYWKGWDVTAIAAELGLKRATVESWKQRDKWHLDPPLKRMEECLYTRFCVLMDKDKKTGADFKEIDALARQMERFARIRRYQEPDGHEGDLNEKVGNRNKGERKPAKPGKNHFTAAQVEELQRIFHEENFEYQELWWANLSQRTRIILKSRQIGASFYFAREALIDALSGGGNQIFLSASKNQAHVFRNYIVAFAARVGVKLTGDPIIVTSELMPDGEPSAELIFLGTNARTAQGYHGNFYFDEFFWTYGFEELNKVARAMASHKRWRKTYLSTPSTIAHQAHPFWTGDQFNKRRKKADRVAIDISHAALKGGRLCEDRIWRHMVTLEDAAAQGCDLFDLDEVREENNADEYANLYGCQFVDDSLSAFRFNDLIACGVDSLVEWTDVTFGADVHYIGDVWAGYDPQESEEGDDAALVIAIPPAIPGAPFRIIERHRLRGDFEQQAQFIEARLRRYRRCSYLGIDKTGVGAGVFQLLVPRLKNTNVVAISYDLAVKAEMVMKAQHVISRARLAFEAGWTDIISAFVSIKRTLTSSGRSVTFKAGRSKSDSHADLAWAIMHILINEPLDGSARRQASVEIF